MVNNIYKICFEKSSFEIDEDFEYLSDYEKDFIYDLDADAVFDYNNENNCYICYIITSSDNIKKYISILRCNNINVTYDDISELVLKFKISLEDILNPILSVINMIKYDFFIEELKNWILENLNIDFILDRISEIGIDNLNELEKEYLINLKNISNE